MLFDVTLREKALITLQREQEHYGTFDLYAHHNGNPFPQLIKTMLSHRTTRQDELAAFNAMWNYYGSWSAVQAADADELARLLAPSRYPEVKAKNIQRTLRRIYRERGAYDIDFLADLPTYDALQWLRGLPGVGMKTATLVLLFCFKKPVIPVDTHVHRVTRRLGIIGENVSADKAHLRLLDILPKDPQTLYNFHRSTLKHGQKICHHRHPNCAACPLQNLCDTYQLAQGR